MKVLKPDNLALLYRAYTFAGRNTLSIGMLAMFPFAGGGRDAVLPEARLWTDTAAFLAESGIEAPLDEGWAKPCGEFMVYGAAHAPNGGQVAQIAVRAKLAGVSKELYVFGDRDFGAVGLPSLPRSFGRQVLSPAAAFGGAGFADNPAGKGFVELARADGSKYRPLPNVELPGQLMAARDDRPQPAGFGALAPDHSLRARHLGRFDDQWMKRSWPHLPDDTRLDYFLAAAPDQRLAGYLKGDEQFELENMHPGRARLSGRLPALRARCFVNRRQGEQREQFSELTVNAETVWLFPDHECGIVLYRAVANPADSDADDILHVMAEWENMADAPLGFDHYEKSFREQIAVVQMAAEAEAPAFEAPAPSAPVIAAAAVAAVGAAAVAEAAPALSPELLEIEKSTQAMQAQIKSLMDQYGLTEADIIKPVTEPPEVSLAEIEEMTAKMEAQTQALLKEHGLTEADVVKPPTEPPPATLEQVQAETRKMEQDKQQLLQEHGVTEAQVQAYLEQQGNEEAARFMREAPLGLAQQQAEIDAALAATPKIAPIAPVSEELALAVPAVGALAALAIPESPREMAKLTREQVAERHAAKAPLAGYDLSGVDLSKLDLSGADFSGSLLEGTVLAGSRLADANLSGCLMQGADCSEADFTNANLAQASAGGSKFAKARLPSAQLTDADFTGADFSEAQLQKAMLDGASFEQAAMAKAQAGGASARQGNFSGADLSGADFGQAMLAQAMFNESKLAAANFKAARCEQAEFYGADASGAQFAAAALDASRADASSRFAQAVFDGAQLPRAAWDGAQLAGASFAGARLDDADFSNVQAPGASFRQASARHAKFGKADLSRADLTGANLFKGSLRKTRVEDAVLHFANAYGVDFEGVTIRAAALEGAETGQTILAFRPPLA